MRILLLVVLVGLARGDSNDGGLVPGGSGPDLVESVCERIQSSCIFPDDKLLMRRMAYVESLDGRNPDTYRDGYHGGIWKVDQALFNTTQWSNTSYVLYQYIHEIQIHFGFDWYRVTWEDCRRPLVSALAARLYIQYESRANHNGIPRDINSQADFWVNYYRPSGNVQDFIDKSNMLETGCPRTTGADIVFVLDGSGSIGSTNFERVKEFTKEVIEAFNIGPDMYKVGVIQFGSRVKTEFYLRNYTTKQALLNAVDNVYYHGGSTNTHLALETLIDVAYLTENGGRNGTVPKVGIIVTDGQSNSQSQTIAEAMRAHNSSIIMLAVGVGSSIDQTELAAIASDPKCLHLFLLTGFSEVEDLKDAIEKRACDAPVVIHPGNNGTDNGGQIPPGENFNCQIKVPSGGATVSLSTLAGTQSTLFLARDTYPSPSYYEERLDSTPNNPGVFYIRNPHASALSNEWILFCNVIGSNGTSTNITFGIRPGDTTHCHSNPCINGDCVEVVDGFRCDCNPGYTGSLCDTEIPNPCKPNPCEHGGLCNPGSGTDFTCNCTIGYMGNRCEQVAPLPSTALPPSGYDCAVRNPCTPENIEQGHFYFPHFDPHRFVQCDAHGGCFVMQCAPGTVWDPNVNACNHPPGKKNGAVKN